MVHILRQQNYAFQFFFNVIHFTSFAYYLNLTFLKNENWIRCQKGFF